MLDEDKEKGTGMSMKKKWTAIGWVALYVCIAFMAELALSLIVVLYIYRDVFARMASGEMADSAQVYDFMIKALEIVQSGEGLIVISALADFILFACFGTWYYFRENKYSYRPDYRRAFTLKNVLCIAGTALFGQYAINLLLTGISILFPDMFKAYEELAKNFDLSTAPPVLMIFVVCLFGPLVEELTFRGMIYGRLRRAFSVAPAAIISALLFGVFHMNWVQGIYATVFGIALAYVYEKTGTIWGSVLLHACFNTASYIIQALDTWLVSLGIPYLGVIELVFELVCVVLVFVLIRRIRLEKKRDELAGEA